MLDGCAALLEDPVKGTDRTGYATLDGRYRGLPVAVRLIPEALVFRRLPQLWLSVSVHAPTGQPHTLDALRRVAGAEFYSPGDRLPERLAVPEGWPGDTCLRGTRGAGTLLDRLREPVAGILRDARVKEVLITPRGTRIVTQLAQGERGAYLLLRENSFPIERVPPQALAPVLEAALILSRSAGKAEHDSAGPRAAA